MQDSTQTAPVNLRIGFRLSHGLPVSLRSGEQWQRNPRLLSPTGFASQR